MIRADVPFGVPLKETFLAQNLKDAGYASRAVQPHLNGGSLRFRPPICTYAPWGARVGQLTK